MSASYSKSRERSVCQQAQDFLLGLWQIYFAWMWNKLVIEYSSSEVMTLSAQRRQVEHSIIDLEQELSTMLRHREQLDAAIREAQAVNNKATLDNALNARS